MTTVVPVPTSHTYVHHSNPGKSGDVTTNVFVPLPGHADYDTGTNRSSTVHKLANVRTATITAPAAEGGGVSCVASDITITNLTPPLTPEMRTRLRDDGAVVPRIDRTDGSGNHLAGFSGSQEIRGYLDDGTSVEVYEKRLRGATFQADISPTGLTNITPALSASQRSQLVGGTIGGTGLTATSFSGAGTAGTYRAKVATVSVDGRTVTFAAGSAASALLANKAINCYAACASPTAAGIWNVSITSYGKDISRPVMDWLVGTIESDDYTDKSGTVSDEVWIEFAQDRCYEINYGINFGTRGATTDRYDYDGINWKKLEDHAWRYVRVRGPDDLVRAHRPTIRAADPTYSEPGILPIQGDVTAGGDTVTNITPALTATQRRRLLGPVPIVLPGPGDTVGEWVDPPRISGPKNNNQNGLFTGGQRTNTGDVIDVSEDGTTVTLADTSNIVESGTQRTMQINLPVTEPGKTNRELFSFAAPSSSGSFNQGTLVERSTMDHDIIVENLNFVDSNGTTRGTATDSRYTPREGWHCFKFSGVDTVTIRNCDLRNIWGDFFFLQGSAQDEINSTFDASVNSENVTIEDVLAVGCGRHAFTPQGNLWLTVRRSAFVGITRLFIDHEPTSAKARMLGHLFEDIVVEYGSGFWHLGGPQVMAAEPPTTIEGCTRDPSQSDVLIVPVNQVDNTFLGAYAVSAGNLTARTKVMRRLGPTRIQLNKPILTAGPFDVQLRNASNYGDYIFRRVNTLTNGGLTIVGDNIPSKARAYFEFDTTADSDTFTNIEFLPREDALTFDATDLPGNWITHLPGSQGQDKPVSADGNQALTDRNAIRTYEIVSATEAKVLAQNRTTGQQFPLEVFRSTKPDRDVAMTYTAGSRIVTTSVQTFKGWDKGSLLTESAGRLHDGTIIDGFTDTPGLAGSKKAILSKGAATAGTTTTTIQGKWRGWTAIVDDFFWNDWLIEECRNVGSQLWTGGSGLYDAGDGPCIMFPARADNLVVNRCYMPAELGTATTYTGAPVAVSSFTGSRTVGSTAQFATTGYAQVVTSTGVAIIAYTGKASGQLTGCTLVAGTGNVATGAVIQPAKNPIVGRYNVQSPPFIVGLTDRGSMSENRFPGAYDNQILQLPTTTVDLTLSFDDEDAVRPYATVTATRSDDEPLQGSVEILRNGVLAASLIFDGTTDTVTGEVWEDSLPGAVWTARWAGSWDTLGVSDVVAPVPTATTTTLSASPSSPQQQGVAITLTATVTPNPAIGSTDTVTFKDGATTIGTADLDSMGVAVLVLPSGRPAGVRSFTAVFPGNFSFLTSTSNAVAYTVTSPPVDVSTATVLTFFASGGVNPVDPNQPNGTPVDLLANVSPDPPGGTVSFYDEGTLLLGTAVPGGSGIAVFSWAFEEGAHPITAVYSGTNGYLGSTSNEVTLTGNTVVPEYPFVVDTSPDDGDAEVSRDLEQITVTWDQSVEDPVVSLRNDDDEFVLLGEWDYVEDDPLSIYWPLLERLEAARFYTIVIDDASSGGLHMQGRVTATFSTHTHVVVEWIPSGLLIADY